MATSQCCDNPPTLDPVYGKGTVVDNFGGLKAYISGSSDSSKPAILLVSDVFGTAYSLSFSFSFYFSGGTLIVIFIISSVFFLV
jgi:hypothetical protein